MAEIRLQNVFHRYLNSEEDTLRIGDFRWRDGGAYALLGPSGCGKSTLLNIISGLIVPTSGQVLFDGEDVSQLDPRARNIAQVFQFPVVYDSMTVFENLAFPLRNRNMNRKTIGERVKEIAHLLELSPSLYKKARGLSADQQQLISLGRGLVRQDVSAILFDEPLTVIDPHQKFKLRRILKDIHRQFKLTLIYVTHDQSEALTFADFVTVMESGCALQTGTPEALYNSPAHQFVGHFIGNPGMNFIPITVNNGAISLHDITLPLAVDQAKQLSGQAMFGIRPEYLSVSNQQTQDASLATLPVTLNTVENHGTHLMLNTDLFGQSIMVKADAVPDGEQLFLHLPKSMTKLYVNEQLVE